MTDRDFVCLTNGVAECKIALFGATLVSYRPKGTDQDIFWVGDLNKFDHAQAIRGGIPICWPRFATEDLNNHLPRHGVARTSDWRVIKTVADAQKAEAEFILIPNEKYKLDATARLLIKMTDKLEYTLETTNNGDEPFSFSEALHCYFNISSINNILIKGLKGHCYKNSLDGQTYTLDGELAIRGEFDSVFMDQTNPIEIVDKGYERIITLEKNGSQTTVVWNPAKDLAEMSEGQYKTFVCVEPSNVGDFAVCLLPHETHRITLKVQIKNLK